MRRRVEVAHAARPRSLNRRVRLLVVDRPSQVADTRTAESETGRTHRMKLADRRDGGVHWIFTPYTLAAVAP